jgi:cytochrome P450
MTGFVPPYPAPMEKRTKLRRLLALPSKYFRYRRSALSSVIANAYSMKIGEIATPGGKIFVPNEPDLWKRVLVEDAAKFPKSEVIADMLGLLMGDSIFVSNGEVWKRQRRMMDPAFEGARIKVVFDLMRDAADALIERMDKLADGSPASIDMEMTHVTADIIFRTIFSIPMAGEDARKIFAAFTIFQETAYAHGIDRSLGLPRFLGFFRHRRAERAAAIIRGVLDPIVKARFDSFHGGEPQTHRDILQSLVSVKDGVAGTHFDLRELCEQVSMLFLAGHETSASSLAWALYLITMDDAVQERLRAEAVSVLGRRPPEFSDMRKLNLARNVFHEALRLYPPVAFLPRTAAEACTLRTKHVPKGATVSISPWLIHRHRVHWQTPDVFDPDRFDRPETAQCQRDAYLPFSKGPRVCLGASFALQEAALIIAMLARRYRFAPVEGFAPEPVARLTVRSENGIRLRVFRR